MTLDKEVVIKALICCSVNRSCEGCPLNTAWDEGIDICIKHLMRNALELLQEEKK